VKILLINPPSPFLIDQFAFPPLGILYLAASLEKAGYDPEVVDASGHENEIKNFLADQTGVDLCGITSTTPQYPYAQKIKDAIKEKNPKCIVVAGGSHPSSVREKCIKDGFDSVVVGEGENAIVEIARKIEAGEQIGKISKCDYIKNLDSIPFPDRKKIDIRRYGYDVAGGKATTIITSRGCPYACAFCSKDVWGGPVRFRSVDNVVEEIKVVMDDFGFDRLLILDDIINLSNSRLTELCKKIEPFGLKWRCYIRANNVTKELLQTMKQAGCVEVGIGVESGSQKILDNVNKKTTVEMNTKVVQMCKEAGIICNVFLMIGLPGETRETVEETRKWFEKVRPQKFGYNIFAPYVGTPITQFPEKFDIQLHDMPDEKSWVKGRSGEYNAFVSTSNLTAEEILRLHKENFKHFIDLTGWRKEWDRNNKQSSEDKNQKNA